MILVNFFDKTIKVKKKKCFDQFCERGKIKFLI